MLSCQRLLSRPIRTQQITAEVKTDFLKKISKKKKQQFKMKKIIEDYLKELPSEILKAGEEFPGRDRNNSDFHFRWYLVILRHSDPIETDNTAQ